MPLSLWLGLKASRSNQTCHAYGQGIDLGAADVCFILSCRGPARHTNHLPQSKCKMAKVNCCRQAVVLVALARSAGKLEPPNLACAWPEHRSRCCSCLCFFLSLRGPKRHTNHLPPSKCEMAKVNCCRPNRQAVALVALVRPAGKMETPNLACTWPE